ncbi:MAG: hypothetical protein KAJ42_16890 [Gemmatimonadetes bacterium]|nr:hypothetical protein [Gemmatimonadota bacterium]
MEMFLVALFTCIFGLGVSVIGFGLATRDEEEEEQPQPSNGVFIPPAQFFLDDIPSADSPARVPADLLMLQLERHVRLEQAAAEAFLDLPTAEILHARTASPLTH